MTYFLIVFSKDTQVFMYEAEDDAARHAEAWRYAFPYDKVMLAEKIVRSTAPARTHGADMDDGLIDVMSTSSDLDLLACLEHLIEEGGKDNFLDATRGGITMEFHVGKGDEEMEWHVLLDDNHPMRQWSREERAFMERRDFVHSTNSSVDGYEKRVLVESKADLVVVVHEAWELLRDIFHETFQENWHLSLYLQS